MSSDNIKEIDNSLSDNKNLKPCCACPETRQLRDECIFEQGEENCLEFIDKHKECLKKNGFVIY